MGVIPDPRPTACFAVSRTAADEPDWDAEWIDLGGEG